MIAGANVTDNMLLAATIDALIVTRPEPTPQQPQHMALDKGYDNPTGHQVVEAYHYQGHIASKRQKPPPPIRGRRHPARRWVVERTFAWLSKCRAILIRYAKRPAVYLGLIQLACILLWYRRLHRLKRLKGF